MKNLKKILLIFSIITISAHAEFKINISDSDMDKALNIIRLQDIGIGEEAYISGSLLLCRGKNNKLKFTKSVKVDNDRKYSKYKIKRLPENKIKIDFVTREFASKKDNIESFFEELSTFKGILSCENMDIFDVKSFFIVDSIEGEKSLSDLWNNVYTKLK